MSAATDLDHVAVAAENWSDLWPRYVGDLGGRWLAGGDGSGFGSAQLRFANGMKLEALSPFAVEVNDFLRRFLDTRGPGPHHLTFKVSDIEASLERAAAAGYRPVGVDLRDPDWKEAFLHPKDAPGVVVQLAQSTDEWASPPPHDLPRARGATASLDHVALGVSQLEDGLRLFGRLLDGEECGRGRDDPLGSDWVELRWPGPGRIRLVVPTEPDSTVHAWIGHDVGRLHHVAFTAPGLDSLDDATAIGDGRYEIAPAANHGTRLLVRAASV